MGSKKITLKHLNLFFHDGVRAGYYPDKQLIDSKNVYLFREVSWGKGVIIDVDQATLKINRNADKSFQLFSLTKNEIDWNKRKIIHKIEIKLDKNIEDEYSDCLSYSIVRVKKDIF